MVAAAAPPHPQFTTPRLAMVLTMVRTHTPPFYHLYMTLTCHLQGAAVFIMGIAAGFLFIAGTLNTIG